MKTLPKVKLGWKALSDTLNSIIDAINERSIRQGAGIHLQESSSGVAISLEAKPIASDPTSATAATDGTSGGSSGDLTALTNRVTALEAILSGGPGWTPVDVMDGGCNRSTIKVLVQP